MGTHIRINFSPSYHERAGRRQQNRKPFPPGQVISILCPKSVARRIVSGYSVTHRMNMSKFILQAAPLALIVMVCSCRTPAPPATQAESASADPYANETPAQRDARMKWWREARFGMFIHWGVYSVPAGTYDGRRDRGDRRVDHEHRENPRRPIPPIRQGVQPGQISMPTNGSPWPRRPA